VDVQPGLVIVPELVAERWLGGILLGDPVLVRRQPRDGLGILAVLVRHVSSFTDGAARWLRARCTPGMQPRAGPGYFTPSAQAGIATVPSPSCQAREGASTQPSTPTRPSAGQAHEHGHKPSRPRPRPTTSPPRRAPYASTPTRRPIRQVQPEFPTLNMMVIVDRQIG